MAASPDVIERELVSDLVANVEQRFADEEFMSDLYRALSNQTWHKDGGPPGHVALSWTRAEEVVNALRARKAAAPLSLAQTGGEGEVARCVEDELGRLGWHHRPLDTGTHDPQHDDSLPGPPPQSRQMSRRDDRLA